MVILFKRITGANKNQLPANVQDYLARSFHLRPEELACLRWVGRKESFNGEPSNHVLIFNETMANKDGLAVKSFDDLANHPELVLFEGRIFSGRAMDFEKKVLVKK